MESCNINRNLTAILFLITFIVCSCSNEKPIASFTVNKSMGCYPLTVSFNAANSQDPDGDISSYSWNFGDGGTGTGVTVNHVYNMQGTLTATLTVTDDSDGIAVSSMTISLNSLDGQWRGTSTPGTVRLGESVYYVTMLITQTYTDPEVVIGTAVWDHLPGVYYTGTGSLDTANNILEMTWTASGFHSYKTNGNYTDDCRSFSGVINGAGFSNDTFTMVWQSLIPENKKILFEVVSIEGEKNITELKQ
jgi:PKD repeat protein